MGQTKRHLFIPERSCSIAYADRPIPIGHGQTISQPFIVAANFAINSSQNDYRKTTKASVHEFVGFKILNCVSPSSTVPGSCRALSTSQNRANHASQARLVRQRWL
jgi:hypothetical protein